MTKREFTDYLYGLIETATVEEKDHLLAYLSGFLPQVLDPRLFDPIVDFIKGYPEIKQPPTERRD